MMENPSKYKIGDTIYWYCDKEQRTHHAVVEFVNFIHIGRFYEDINYKLKLSAVVKRKLYLSMNMTQCQPTFNI